MTTLPNDDIPSYIRPPRRRPSAYRDPEFRTVRNWLNIVFMLACIATVVVYFTATGSSGRLWFIGMGMAAVAVKMVEVVIRTLTYTRRHHGHARDDEED